MITSQNLAALMADLNKGTVGYQTPLVPAGGSQTANNLSPLVPSAVEPDAERGDLLNERPQAVAYA